MKLSDMDKDILVEIANVGAGNATTPLSKIFDTKVGLSLGSLEILSLKNAKANSQLKKQFAIGMHTPIIKGMTSDIAILFTANSINKLVEMRKDERVSKQNFLE
jgi:chemotaxis protein CheC